MRSALFAVPIVAASLMAACSNATPRSGFIEATNGTTPGDGGTTQRGTFSTTGGAAGGDGGAANCSSSEATVTRAPVVIEFLLDESSSMDMDGKWDAATAALQAAFDDMHSSADASTYVGLARFSDDVDHRVAPAPLTDDAHYQALSGALADGPDRDTATLDGLNAVYGVVDGFTPSGDASGLRRVVVLLSDGLPNGGTDEQNACVLAAASELAKSSPVSTFAVGIGPFPSPDAFEYDPAFMGQLAVAGGTAPAGCDPASTDTSDICHFQVTPGDDVNATKQQLIDALTKIRALSASCDFPFTLSKGADLTQVSVDITDATGNVQTVAKDPTNGWSFDDANDPKAVVLHGAACTASGAASSHVGIVIGCRVAE